MSAENQPQDNGLLLVPNVTNAKISGKCGILSGEIVSPVEIVRIARYGTRLNEYTHCLVANSGNLHRHYDNKIW